MEHIQNVMNIAEGVRNFVGIDEKMENLKRKFEDLKSREEDIKEELEYAERLSLKKRRKVVENWLANVESVKNEVEQMEKKVRERSWLPHFSLEGKLGRLTERVIELDQKGHFPEGLTLEAHGNQQIELITTKLISQTFQQHKDAIWEWLRSDNVSKIGIYGMGGVGKTTLVTHIHNELCKIPNSSVSWVTVSQNFSVLKLQSDIANSIKLQLENDDDERRRAAKLAWGLRNMNNFVLILDDVWQHFQLDEVGIPTGGNGCNLILTSRSFDVCRRIGCEEYIKVEPLPEKEAWELFTEKLGHGRALSPEIEPIAKSLTRKCCGLPLGIITMAGSMRGVEDEAEWSDALEKLKESVPEPDDDMGNEVFKVLKYSYDQLKDPKVQQCFLYCSLFPEDYVIGRETLVEHFIDERFVDKLRSRQAELNRGYTILNKLEKVCLLEGCMDKYDTWGVKMHDLVRSMAIQIGRVNFQYSVETEKQLTEILGEDTWAKDLTKLSLMEKDISCIPSSASPKCPRLSTLMLNHIQRLRSIPDCFFSHMPQISVLDLSRTDIENLPTSISDLVNLTALWLEYCKRLKYVPSLENLKALRRLNLRGTKITEVPQGMEMLLNLRYLNLEGTEIEMIPDGILPKLSCVQYLGIENEFRYDIGSPRFDIGSSRSRKVRVEEIVKLTKLETFKGYLNDMEDFNKYVRWRENNRGGPNNYLLLLVGLGNESFCYFFKEDDFDGGYERSVFLKECKISSKSKGEEDSEYSMPVLPTDVQFLYIEACNDAISLCDIASLNNAIQLRKCFIQGCKGMEHVVCRCSCNLPLIQSLVSLNLSELEELRALIGREICCASTSASASSSKLLLQTPMFSSLQRVSIYKCPKIKRLFTPVLLLNLQNIVELKVLSCENMVEIIRESSDEDEDGDGDGDGDGVESSDEEIFCASASASASASSSKLLQTPMFSSLQSVEIENCPKIKRLFAPVLLSNLKHLQKLTVTECYEMVEIIGEASSGEDEDDENQEAVSTTSFISALALPKLSCLELALLPELKRFCKKEIVFDSLKEIQLYGCPKLSFNGDRVQYVETDYDIYSVVNSRIGERIDEEF